MAVAKRSRIKFVSRPSLRPFSSYAADVYAFLIGLTIPFSTHFIGDLPVGEVLLLCAMPLLIAFGVKRAFRENLRTVYVLMALWLLGLIVADVYNDTSIVDRMRGMALIVFFGLDLVALCILLGRNERRKLWFFVGVTIGALASVKLQPSEASDAYPWKFGYAWGTMQAVILICCFFYSRRRYVEGAICIVALIVVNLLFNFRSPVLYLLITLVLVFPVIPERIGRLQILPGGMTARVVTLAILSIGAAGFASTLVDFVTHAGYIDAESQAKNESQSQSGNLLLGGRPEFVIGLRAALDSPIIGHGSWAHDMKYFEMLNDMEIEEGVIPEQGDPDAEADGLIPGHSHIVTAWVWAGILGLIFWIYLIWMIFKGVVQVTILKPALAPLYMWMMLGTVWDIFFSPFAFTRRIGEAILIVIVADLIEKKVVVAPAVWRRMGAINSGRFFGQGSGSTAPAQPR